MWRSLPALLLLSTLAAAAPTRIGLVGGHRVGYGGVLLRAGLNYRYLDIRESCEVGELAAYDVILCSNVWSKTEPWAEDSMQAVQSYVEQGGHALLSMGFVARDALPLKGRKYVAAAKPPEETGRAFALVPGDHGFLKRFEPRHRWEYGAAVNRLDEVDEMTVLARFTEGEAAGHPALVAAKYGRGELLYSAIDLAYIQGDWFPLYDDLILAAVDYLTGGRAKPVFDSGQVEEPVAGQTELAPQAERAVPAGFSELGDVPSGGYAIRVPFDVPRKLRLENGLELALTPGAAEFRQPGGKPARARLAAAHEVIVFRRPARLDLLVDGGSVAGWDKLPPPAGQVAVDRADGLVYQPCEPPYFGDDFTRDGELSEPWQRGNGLWRLTGTGPPYVRSPSFALRGRDGWVTAGEWFWSDYELAVSARPQTARHITLRVGEQGQPGYEFRVPVEQGNATLSRVGPQWTPLGEADGAAPIGQWTRLSLSVIDGQVSAAIDGRTVLEAQDTTRFCGGIGIGIGGGEAFLDDVVVQRPDPVSALPEVHPIGFDRGPDGLMDRDTWSHPAAAWVPDDQTGTLWQIGRFAGDFELTVPFRADRGGAKMAIAAALERVPGHEVIQARLTPGVHWLTLARQGEVWSGSVDGQPRTVAPPAEGSVCLGLQPSGGRILIEGLRLRASDVSEMVFEQAPAGWWATAGDWQTGSRWPCMPQFSWLNGTARPTAELWQKTPVAGDLVAQALIGARMLQRLRSDEQEKFDGMRLTICGNGRDPRSGYSLELAADPSGYTRLYRGKRIVATSTVGMPPWRERHNLWVDLRLERHGNTIAGWYQNRCLFRYTDPDPLKDGQVGVSTPHDTLVTPYLAVYGVAKPARALPDKVRTELAAIRRQRRFRAGVQAMPAVTVLKQWLGIPEG